MEKCAYCSKPIKDLKDGDIPYHVECLLEHLKQKKSLRKDGLPQANSDSI